MFRVVTLNADGYEWQQLFMLRRGQHVLNKTDYLRLSACVHMCCAGVGGGGGGDVAGAGTCALSPIQGQTSSLKYPQKIFSTF